MVLNFVLTSMMLVTSQFVFSQELVWHEPMTGTRGFSDVELIRPKPIGLFNIPRLKVMSWLDLESPEPNIRHLIGRDASGRLLQVAVVDNDRVIARKISGSQRFNDFRLSSAGHLVAFNLQNEKAYLYVDAHWRKLKVPEKLLKRFSLFMIHSLAWGLWVAYGVEFPEVSDELEHSLKSGVTFLGGLLSFFGQSFLFGNDLDQSLRHPSGFIKLPWSYNELQQNPALLNEPRITRWQNELELLAPCRASIGPAPVKAAQMELPQDYL